MRLFRSYQGSQIKDEIESKKLCSRTCSIRNRKFSPLVVTIMKGVGICTFIGIGEYGRILMANINEQIQNLI